MWKRFLVQSLMHFISSPARLGFRVSGDNLVHLWFRRPEISGLVRVSGLELTLQWSVSGSNSLGLGRTEERVPGLPPSFLSSLTTSAMLSSGELS